MEYPELVKMKLLNSRCENFFFIEVDASTKRSIRNISDRDLHEIICFRRIVITLNPTTKGANGLNHWSSD